MRVIDFLRSLNPTLPVVILDFDECVLEEGPAAGLLDESLFLYEKVIYFENSFPYVLMLGYPVGGLNGF